MRLLSCLLSVLFVICVVGISSAGQFGPAEPAAKEGKPSIGIGYFYSETKMKSSDIEGLIFQSNQVYLQGSYSFVKNWEIYGRIGGADMREKETGFQDNMKTFGSLGVRGLLYDDGLFGFGPFIQGTIYSNYSDRVTSGGATGKFSVENPWEGVVGLAAQIKKGNFMLYYGPFAYMARNKLKVRVAFDNLTVNDSTTLKEKGNFGGFLGINVLAAKGLNIGIEGQYTGKFSVGGICSYSF